MKHFLLLLFAITLFVQPIKTQDSLSQKTYTVVTAEGERTVSANEQNKQITDRLKQMRREKQEQQESKHNQKQTLKVIGKIASLAILISIITWWRKRKAKGN